MKKFLTIGEKYYIHIHILNIFLFLFYLLGINNSFLYTSILDYKNIKSDPFDGAVYPIEFSPDPFLLSYSERKQDYDAIDSKYFIKLPKYDPNIFGQNPDEMDPKSSSYREVLVSRIVYTIPYLGTYNFDYKEYSGSHPGIDIVVPEGTPIRSIANGVIVDTGYQPAGFGNYVVIRHDNVKLTNGKTGNVYSVYAHMSKVSVTAGNKVKKGENIGKVGHTGTATTSHLHFQMDSEDSPYHPYWPFTSSDMKSAGVGFFDGVNIGLGKENAILYTVNPLKFVNDNSSSILVDNNTQENINYTNNNNYSNVNLEVPKEEIKNDNEDLSNSGNTSNNEENNNSNEENNNSNEVNNTGTIVITPEVIDETPIKETLDDKDVDLLSAIDEGIILNDNNEVKVLSNSNSNLFNSGGNVLVSNENKDENQDPEQELINLLNNLENENTSEDLLADKIFSDIPNDYKYYNEIKYFKDNSIISGFSDNTFRPENNVTRAESLKIIFLSLNIKPIDGEDSKFNDIKTNSWENTYINAGINSGVISTQNKYFYPFRDISRVEALKIILTLAGANLDDLKKDLNFTDVNESDWYYDYVNYAVKNELLPTNSINFYPTKPLSREELVSILYKFIKK